MKYDSYLDIDGKKIGSGYPTYFIADIAANHDGDLNKAIDLIHLSAEAGSDAAKFQHFTAKTIVSDVGFKSLGDQQSHQASWNKSVFDVYDEASINRDWTKILSKECQKAGISFFTSPYSKELVDEVDSYLPAYKIGSGDISWKEIIQYIASKNKPYFLASGASSMDDVVEAVEAACEINPQFSLMQCNTNYTGSLDNFKYIQLNVLKSFKQMYPGMVLGLSDHTPGHTTVLGAVALGASAIEKHFTSDNNQDGPDHGFSMDPQSWKEMVDRTRELELSLGNGIKRIEENEIETAVLQRRSIRAKRDLLTGEKITTDNTEVLRPCPSDGLKPNELSSILGKIVSIEIKAGEHIKWKDLE